MTRNYIQERQSPNHQLLFVTCRDHPSDPDIHDYVPLPAGRYNVYRIRRDLEGAKPNEIYTCPDTARFLPPEPVEHLPKGDCIIVIHGFNTTESQGIGLAFNVQYALRAWGVPLATEDADATKAHIVGFTWPCDHTLLPGYMLGKQEVSRFAAFSLLNLLFKLREEQSDRRIHIIAHSMGCYLTLKALNILAVLQPFAHMLPMLDAVIWCAPDINADALECSTDNDLQTHGWRHADTKEPRALVRVQHAFERPHPLTEQQHQFVAAHVRAGQAPIPLASQRALDGYGYAALNAMKRLAIYSSLHDEAMWASPLANRFTEDAGSGDGGVRLGWCGPLHPGLMMIPEAGVKRSEVTLLECSDIVWEHFDYFYHPVVQRDIASRVWDAAPTTNPFVERQDLPAWNAETEFAYPTNGEPQAPGLHMYQMKPPEARNPDRTQPRKQAPARKPSDSRMYWLWNPMTSEVGKLFVQMLEWHYGLLGRRDNVPVPRAVPVKSVNGKVRV